MALIKKTIEAVLGVELIVNLGQAAYGQGLDLGIGEVAGDGRIAGHTGAVVGRSMRGKIAWVG
jgi:hypothetical protein